MTRSTRSSATAASILTFGRKSTTYSAPRYSSVWPFCRPKPLTSVTVKPEIPTSDNASRTSSSLNGLMIASIFFMLHLWDAASRPEEYTNPCPPDGEARPGGGRQRPAAPPTLSHSFHADVIG